MHDNPWARLELPSSPGSFNGRRVDPESPWGFFWARDIGGSHLLILRHASESTGQRRLPRLKGVEINTYHDDARDESMLVFKLIDTEHLALFRRFCEDIVSATAVATAENEAIDVVLARTWRWHHMLMSEGTSILSPEEQKGLIGELLVLEKHLITKFPPSEAVSMWTGPYGTPKDFEIGRVGVEVKARRGTSRPYITISSEYQLDCSGVDVLFLQIVELSRAYGDHGSAFTVTDLADRVRRQIAIKDSGATVEFDAVISAAGFSWDDSYADYRWIEGTSWTYRIGRSFPRIVLHSLPHGVSDVSYSIAMTECVDFLVEPEVLNSAILGGMDVS